MSTIQITKEQPELAKNLVGESPVKKGANSRIWMDMPKNTTIMASELAGLGWMMAEDDWF